MSDARIIVEPYNPKRIPEFMMDSDGCYSLDLFPGVAIPISKQCCDEKPCRTNVVTFNRSYSVSIPNNNKNKLLLENPFSPQLINSTFFNQGFLKATIINNVNIINGYLTVTKGAGTGLDKKSIEIAIVDDQRDWVDKLKLCKINELDLGIYEYNNANLLARLQNPDPMYPNEMVWVPCVFQGTLASGEINKWIAEDFRFIPFVKFIVDKLFEKIGYTLKSEFMESPFFNKLGIDIIEDFGYTQAQVDNNSAFIGLENNQNFPSGSIGNINFDKTDEDYFNNGTNYATPNYTAPFDMLANVNIRLSISGLGIFGGTGNDPTGTISLIVNNVVYQSNDYNLQSQSNIIVLNIPSIPLLSGQTLRVRFDAPDVYNSYNIVEGASSFRVTPSTYLPTGIDITLTDYINGKYNGWRLIEDLMKIFGLRYDVEKDKKIVYMEPENRYRLWGEAETRNGFYKPINEAVDWTDRLTNCKPSSDDSGARLEYYNYNWLVDNNDKYLNKDKQANTPEFPGLYSLRFDFKDIFPQTSLRGQCSTDLKFFSASKNVNFGNNVSAPSISSSELLNAESLTGFYEADPPIRTLKHTPRLYYFRGYSNDTSGTVRWIYEGIEHDMYPAAWMVNSLVTDPEIPSLSFDSSDETFNTRSGLFERFHLSSVRQKNLSGIVTMMFNLSCEDVANFDCRRLICVDGNFYTVVKIENWFANEPHLPTPVKLRLFRDNYQLL